MSMHGVPGCMVGSAVLTLQTVLLSDTQRSLSCDLGKQWTAPRLGGSNRWNGLNHTAVMQLLKIRIKIIRSPRDTVPLIDMYRSFPIVPPFRRHETSIFDWGVPLTELISDGVLARNQRNGISCGQCWQWNYFDTAIALESWLIEILGGAATRKCVLYKEGREKKHWIPKLL